MNKATSAPTATPVKRIRLADDVRRRIVVISRKEISTSATNAVTTPNCPGNVTAYSIGGSVKVGPKREATDQDP